MNWKTFLGLSALALLAIAGAQASGKEQSGAQTAPQAQQQEV